MDSDQQVVKKEFSISCPLKETLVLKNGNVVSQVASPYQREFFIDNLLVRSHFIIVMIRWTGLASWELEEGTP